MSAPLKRYVYNPVMDAPWRSGNHVFESPKPEAPKKKARNKSAMQIAKSKLREANVEILLRRYPGLRKYQARAVLIVSDNELNKAIVLLEVSNCYRREVLQKEMETAEEEELKSISIGLHYRTRKIMKYESFLKDSQEAVVPTTSSVSSTLDRAISPRVGVVIAKTENGYKANLLN